MSEQAGWFAGLKKINALWLHDNQPDSPHAVLPSGIHSSGYFNATMVAEDPHFLHEIVCYLLSKAKWQFHDVRRVMGSAMGAITFAHDFARVLGCKSGYTELSQHSRGMFVKRFRIEPGDRVLMVEDTMTTGGTTLSSIQVIEAKDAVVLPVIFVIANRTGKQELNGRQLISLVDLDIQTWPPEECPLCARGSLALRPKEYWDILMQNS